MHRRVVVVLQLDHQTVTGGDGHRARLEPHPHGSHLDGRGLARRGDAAGAVGAAQRGGRIHGERGAGRQDHHQKRRQATHHIASTPGRDLRTGRARGDARRLLARRTRGRLLTDRRQLGADGTDHHRQEQHEPEERQRRPHHAGPTGAAGHQEHQQTAVDQHQTEHRQAVHLDHPRAHRRRPTAHHGRHEKAHRTEQDLGRRTREQRRGDRPQLVHPARRDQPRRPAQRDRKPHQTARDAHRRELPRRRGASGPDQVHQVPQHGPQVHGQRGRRHQVGTSESRARRHHDRTRHHRKGPGRGHVLTVGHRRAQDRRPEGHQRGEDRDPHEPQDVDGEVERVQPDRPLLGHPDAHERARHRPGGQERGRDGVITHDGPEPGGGRRPDLPHQIHHVPGHGATDDGRAGHHGDGPRTDHSRDQHHDPGVEHEDPADLERAGLLRRAPV